MYRNQSFLLFVVTLFMAAGVLSAQSITLEKYQFNPGETIRVSFSAPAGLPENAWIGIIPSNVPHGSEAKNDEHDLTYQYLKGTTSGTLTFQAPDSVGSYDFRMHDTDSNGKEIASVTFKVVVGQATLWIPRNTYFKGEEIPVLFETQSTLPKNAWIGIIPSNVSHGSEAENDKYDLTYQYLEGRLNGTLKFKAPQAPGSYDFRLHDTDDNGRELASITFTVE